MNTPTMNEIITEMARYVKDSGFSVERNDAFCWVDITSEDDGTAFFLENDEAEQFILEAEGRAQEANVDLEVALLAQAKQYIDCL